jgi:hypothetical protein
MQLDAALELIADAERGVVLYVRGHEGRGIGLLHKLQAYQLQDRGRDTVDANLDLGLPADARDYGTGAQILVDLGIHTMRLVTNNPTKRAALEGFGLEIVDRVPLPVAATPENLHYLQTKRDRMGHELPDLPPVEQPAGEQTMDNALGTGRAAVLPPKPGETGDPVSTAPPRPATPLRSGLAGIIHDDDDETDDDGRVREGAR